MVEVKLSRDDAPALAWAFVVPSELAGVGAGLVAASQDTALFKEANEPVQVAAAFLATALDALDAEGAGAQVRPQATHHSAATVTTL